jgi:hypothetical protein
MAAFCPAGWPTRCRRWPSSNQSLGRGDRLCAEAPFAAIGGALLPRQAAAGAIGCILIFEAILLVQLWPDRRGIIET